MVYRVQKYEINLNLYSADSQKMTDCRKLFIINQYFLYICTSVQKCLCDENCLIMIVLYKWKRLSAK